MDVEKNKDGTFKQDDGKYLIPDSIIECDPHLAERLTEIAKGERSVVSLQNAGFIPNAVYFDEYLTVEGRNGDDAGGCLGGAVPKVSCGTGYPRDN